MDPLAHQIAEGSIDHPLPFDAAPPFEPSALDIQREMELARGYVAAVPAMLLAVVDQLDGRWRKRRVEAAKHLCRDGTGAFDVHRPYIEGFNDIETRQASWTGGRGEGEVRYRGLHCAW